METIFEGSLNEGSDGYDDKQIEQQHGGSAKNVVAQYFPKDFVVVAYEEELWPGQIETNEEERAYVKCMAHSELSWKWSEKKNKLFSPLDDIKSKIEEQKKMSTKRSVFQIPEWKSRWGKSNNNCYFFIFIFYYSFNGVL